MRNCRHGFNPVDGPGLWCPGCEEEERTGRRVHAQHGPPNLPQRILAWFGLWP